MPFGFLCCGPSVVDNVSTSSDDDSSQDGSDFEAEIVVTRKDALKRESEKSRPPGSTAVTQHQFEGTQHGNLREAVPLVRQSSVLERISVGFQAIFSPRPLNKRHGARKPWIGHDRDDRKFFLLDDETARTEETSAQSMDESRDSVSTPLTNPLLDSEHSLKDARHAEKVLNLAFRQTLRLPDVAGYTLVQWAAGIMRIDLTETGIRTLRGLDSFPNVETLVLDGNGLLGLPSDIPWMPSIEALSMCNNCIEDLDRYLGQVREATPRLKSLVLMGNPVWPAAPPLPRARGRDERRNRIGDYSTKLPGNASISAELEVLLAGEGRGEMLYRAYVLRHLPGLMTLDSAEVTENERVLAKQMGSSSQTIGLHLDPDATTDVDESLLKTSPSDDSAADECSHGVGKLLEEQRARRANLPDRTSLPSTWSREPIVMDIGSGWAKMGLAGVGGEPSAVFPSLVGRMDLRSYDRVLGQDEKVFVGTEAVEEAGKRAAQRALPDGNGPMPLPMVLNRVVSDGVVTDWDDMEELWRYGIENVMGLDAVDHPILMADSTSTTPEDREKATEMLFETLSTPAVHIALQPVLALYACSESSGLVVDIGASGTQIAPIYDGFVAEKGIRRLELGGEDITKRLGALVNGKVGLMGGDEFNLDDPVDLLRLDDLKADVCFCSENLERDNARMELSMTKSHLLPDGTRISLGRERYRSTELLFDPSIALREEDSLQMAVLDSILSCERKTWSTLSRTVILTGGSSELRGLNRRLQRELTKISRANGIKLKFTVMVPEDNHNSMVWMGGSMLASTGSLDGLWYTREQYEEYGAGQIHEKFAA